MSDTPTTCRLAEALAKAQAEYKLAKLDGSNPHYGSRFSTLAALHEASKPALCKYGLSINHTTHVNEGGMVLITTLRHSSGEDDSSTYPIAQGRSPQETASAITYATRYSYRGIAGVASEPGDDDDGNAASQAKPAAGKKTATPPKAAAPEQDGDYRAKRKQIADMLMEMCDNNPAKAKSRLKYFTSFPGRDGTIVDGKEDTSLLSPKALAVTLDKISKEYAIWKGDQGEAPDDTDLAPLDEQVSLPIRSRRNGGSTKRRG